MGADAILDGIREAVRNGTATAAQVATARRLADGQSELAGEAMLVLAYEHARVQAWQEVVEQHERARQWARARGDAKLELRATIQLLPALHLVGQGEYAEAVLEAAEPLAVRAGTATQRGWLKKERATRSFVARDYGKAADFLGQADGLFAQDDNEVLVLDSRRERVLALALADQEGAALELSEELPDEGGCRAVAYALCGVVLRENDELSKALKWYARALDRGALPTVMARTFWFQRSEVEHQLGLPRPAFCSLQRAVALTFDKAALASFRPAGALTPDERADLGEEADAHQREAMMWMTVALAPATGYPLSPEARTLLDRDPPGPTGTSEAEGYAYRACFWLHSGSPEAAIADVERGLRFDDPDSEFLLRAAGVEAHLRKKDYGGARALLDVQDADVPVHRHALLLYWRGLVELEARDRAAANRALTEAATVADGIMATFPAVHYSVLLGVLSVRLSEFPSERGLLSLLDDTCDALRCREPSLLAAALQLRGVMRESTADLVEAGEIFDSSGAYGRAAECWAQAATTPGMDDGERVELLEDAFHRLSVLLAVLPFDRARIALRARHRTIAQQLVRHLAQHDIDRAFRIAVQAKSEALLHLLRVRARHEGGLGARVEACGRTLAFSVRQPPLSPSALLAGPGALRSAPVVDVDREQLESLYRELTRPPDGGFATLDPCAVPGLEEVQASLPAETGLVEYLADTTGCCAFVVTPRKVVFRVLTWDSDAQDALRTLRRQLHDGGGGNRSRRRRLRSALRALHGYLLAPLEECLSDISNVVVATSGAWATIPFRCLIDAHGAAAGERWHFCRVSSSALLPGLKAPRCPPNPRVLVLRGDDAGHPPLQHASEEAVAVASLLKGAGARVVELDERAPAAQVRAELARCDLVHFAGHAAFDREGGMGSCLCTPGSPLSAVELLGLDLSAVRLVTLSACETGRVDERSGDEFVGLLRALTLAGADAVVCATWAADDASTCELVTTMYRRWIDGASLAAALGNAALALATSDNGEWSDEWYWGNFTLYGVPG